MQSSCTLDLSLLHSVPWDMCNHTRMYQHIQVSLHVQFIACAKSFCNWALKHYPVYIISQTRWSTNIFVWWSGLKHDSTQIVVTAIIKCLSELYILFQWHRKYFCLTFRLERIITCRTLVTTIYNWNLMPVICDQVTQCSGSLTFSRLVSMTSTNGIPPYKEKELWITHDHTCP